MNDTCVILKSVGTTLLIELQACKQIFYHSWKKRRLENDFGTTPFVVEFAQAIGEDAFNRLVDLA